MASDLGELMRTSEQVASERESVSTSEDFADACLRVEGRLFRSAIPSSLPEAHNHLCLDA